MPLRRWYHRYVLGVLTLLLTLNFLDRGLIVLFLQSIKEDLRLTDTQLGLLTGVAFGSFYALLGLPIARWADRGNRVTIASFAIGLWGLTVMLLLWVRSFSQLVAVRVAAAVGESGALPSTYSLLGDYFPEPSARIRAMTIYWLASPLSVLISLVAGGQLSAHLGWRTTFFIMGLPAIAVAPIIKLTVHEPRSGQFQRNVRKAERQRLGHIVAALWRRRSTRHLTAAIILLCTMGAGLGPWYGAFMIRSHHMETNELGRSLGLIFGLSGFAGVLCGGYVASRWLEGDEAAQMRVTAVAVALLVPFCALFLLAAGSSVALTALGAVTLVTNFFFGPTFALIQRLVADDARATAVAVIMTFANLIGMGLGPELVGIWSDVLHPLVGVDSLRYAMLGISVIAWWSAYHFWQAGRALPAEMSSPNA